MKTIQKYYYLDWFELKELIEAELEKESSVQTYLGFLDELYLRKIDSVSEGGTYKIKALAEKISNSFVQKGFSNSVEQDRDFQFALTKIISKNK